MKPCKKFIKQSAKEFRVDQGDIYSNISFFKCIDISSGNLNLNKLDFSNVLVLSQTCDLCRESEKGNSILSVLVVPLFPLEEFKLGKHLEGLGVETDSVSTKVIERYRKKEHVRYRIIDLDEEEKIKYHLEDSFVIDFRYFFTADISQFSRKKYKISLNNLFREDISQSFSNYLSRIGLPEIKK